MQPLLEEHFDYDELCMLKENVLKEHQRQYEKKYIEQEKDKENAEIVSPPLESYNVNLCSCTEDLHIDSSDDENLLSTDLCSVHKDDDSNIRNKVCEDGLTPHSSDTVEDYETLKAHLVDENSPIFQTDVLLAIFSYLLPPDRGRCAQVCSSWRNAVYTPSLWKELYPIQWARGIWRWKNVELGVQLEDIAWRAQLSSGDGMNKWDEDADIDESEENIDPIAEKELTVLEGYI